MGTHAEPTILISNQALNSVDAYKYLVSTITSNLSLDSVLNALYAASSCSTLLYGRETWPIYTRQEARLNTLHFRFPRKILEITSKDKITNQEVLETAELPTIQYLLSQRRLCYWLGHGLRAPSKRPTLWTGWLAQGKQSTGRPLLRYKDVCKRDMKAAKISVGNSESLADELFKSRVAVKAGCKRAKVESMRTWVENRQSKKASTRRTR